MSSTDSEHLRPLPKEPISQDQGTGEPKRIPAAWWARVRGRPPGTQAVSLSFLLGPKQERRSDTANPCSLASLLWLRSDHRLLITVSTSPQNEVILLHSDKVNQAAMLESQWRTWYWLCVCQGTCNLPSGAYNLTVKLSILHPVIGREKKITRIQERFPFVREIGKTML